MAFEGELGEIHDLIYQGRDYRQYYYRRAQEP